MKHNICTTAEHIRNAWSEHRQSSSQTKKRSTRKDITSRAEYSTSTAGKRNMHEGYGDSDAISQQREGKHEKVHDMRQRKAKEYSLEQ